MKETKQKNLNKMFLDTLFQIIYAFNHNLSTIL